MGEGPCEASVDHVVPSLAVAQLVAHAPEVVWHSFEDVDFGRDTDEDVLAIPRVCIRS